MPIYSYFCDECEREFEELVPMSHRTEDQVCPDCTGAGHYMVSAPFLKAYLDSDKWVKNRESHIRKEKKNMENHGTYK